MKRKLTTIFCADVQNYSAKMSADEVGTHKTLQRYRKIIYKCFEARDGRKVNTWGDAVIGEFASVVEAVRCAVEIQDAIVAENRDLDKRDQMWLRIGINLGDVMEEDGDIYGDGVNVAARLEAMADPGGIMVSENVYNLSHKQLAIGYDYAGDQQVKKGEEPITSYRVRVKGSNRPHVENPDIDQVEKSEPLNYSNAHSSQSDSKIPGIVAKISNYITAFQNWFPSQSRGVKTSVFMIGFFATINVLFSGIATPWFIFPSAPFALHIFMSMKNKN